jgi:DNA end-binding protein Ku
MHGLLWPDEVRAPEGVAPDVDVSVRDKELDLADALMDTLGEVDLEDLHDEYRAALEEVIAAKAAGEAPPETPEPAKGGKVLDLMAALEKSVRAAKEARGEEARGEEAEVTPMPSKRPRAAAKKTPTKRPAAKKATAAKTSAEKSTARKSTARKTTVAKTTAKESTAKKSTAKESTAKKSTAKESTAKKTVSPRKRSA